MWARCCVAVRLCTIRACVYIVCCRRMIFFKCPFINLHGTASYGATSPAVIKTCPYISFILNTNYPIYLSTRLAQCQNVYRAQWGDKFSKPSPTLPIRACGVRDACIFVY